MVDFTKTDNDTLYIHWLVPIAILILFIMFRPPLSEGFDLDTIKREVNIANQTGNEQIAYTVNSVPYLLDYLRGRSYYPSTISRRPDSIINPMRESILRGVLESTGNLPSLYSS